MRLKSIVTNSFYQIFVKAFVIMNKMGNLKGNQFSLNEVTPIDRLDLEFPLFWMDCKVYFLSKFAI